MVKTVTKKLILTAYIIVFINVHVRAYAANSESTENPKNTEIQSQELTVNTSTSKTSVIVGKIGDYIIEKNELEKRLLSELYPDQYEPFDEDAVPADANSVLMSMLAEKAMIMEARKLNYQDKENIQKSVKDKKNESIINLLSESYLKKNVDKIAVTKSEIEQKIKAEPNLNEEQVKKSLQTQKARSLLNQYYKEIYKKLEVKKITENFPKAIKVHDRLLNNPVKKEKIRFIRKYQIMDETTEEEKNIVLATFTGGKITLLDWFETLHGLSPPSRSKDLNTIKGFDNLLERTLPTPLLVTEAKLQGFDKDQDMLRKVREYEDTRLLNEIRSEKRKEVNDPTSEETIEYFNNNKEMFSGKKLRIDQIWCQDLDTAKRVKAELDNGKDFEDVKQQYCLNKKGKPFDTYPNIQGLFWNDLWKGEPNEIIGPIKGFYTSEIKWRIVKILEKEPGKPAEFSQNLETTINNYILSQKIDVMFEEYGRELLKKYSYEIFPDRIKDINPLDIP